MTMLLFLLVILIVPKSETTAEAFASFIQDSQKRLQENSDIWDDPFSLFTASDDFNQTDVVYSGGGATATSPCDLTHFCFLVHGFRGHSRDLGYVKTAMKNTAELYNTTTTRLVLHSVSCNEKRTDDGVKSGGERLVQEMKDVMAKYPSKNITVSILGNSLGGLYARYAIARLEQTIPFNVFCTTATPHLGIAGHTWLKIPRSAEIGISTILGNTGKDLFRVNGLLSEMAQSDEYLEPLRKFKKRILYANAYGTDFPVPASTAAFLHGESTYPHRILNVQKSISIWTPSIHECDVARSVFCNPNEGIPSGNISNSDNNNNKENEEGDPLARMSLSLDSLGWKKVFVDLRSNVPKLPFGVTRRSNSNSDNNSDLKSQQVLQSREVAHHVKNDYNVLPNAHNKIVAFSRSKFSTYLNKAGRPVVDELAKEVIHDIFSYKAV